MVEIRITYELLEWVQERLHTDADEAQVFTEEFTGMMYFTGAFVEKEAAAPALLAALEMAVLGFSPSRYLQGSQAGELIQLHQTAQRAGMDTATYILNTIRAAIAAVKGEAS